MSFLAAIALPKLERAPFRGARLDFSIHYNYPQPKEKNEWQN